MYLLIWSLFAACPKPNDSIEDPYAGAPPPTLAEINARGLAAVELAPQTKAAELVLTGARVMTATGQVLDPGWVELEGLTLTYLASTTWLQKMSTDSMANQRHNGEDEVLICDIERVMNGRQEDGGAGVVARRSR